MSEGAIWLPPRAAQEQLDIRRRHEAALQHMLMARAQFEEWNAALKAIDPYLELVKAHEGAKAPGLKPGYYHVMRHNPGSVPWVMPVEGPEGEFREPDSQLFDQLRSMDNWDSRARGDRDKRMAKLEEQQRKRKAMEREARLDEALQRFKSLENPSIRFGGSWTKKAGARKG